MTQEHTRRQSKKLSLDDDDVCRVAQILSVMRAQPAEALVDTVATSAVAQARTDAACDPSLAADVLELVAQIERVRQQAVDHLDTAPDDFTPSDEEMPDTVAVAAAESLANTDGTVLRGFE